MHCTENPVFPHAPFAVNCVLVENMVEIDGGGLNHQYSALNFHFHWGSSSDYSVGSEHTVNSKRYPMEVTEKVSMVYLFSLILPDLLLLVVVVVAIVVVLALILLYINKQIFMNCLLFFHYLTDAHC